MSDTLALRDVSVAYNRGTPDELWPLEELSLTLAARDYVTIVGPNGAGKSTLLNAIAGTVIPARGRVEIDGRDVTRVPDHRRARHVARVMQDPRQNTCEDLSIAENLAVAMQRGARRSWWRRATSSSELERGLDLLARYAPALEGRRHDLAGRLSGGQRQVLAMVMAVTSRPTVLLLDEHTSALDPETAERVMTLTDELVGEAGITTAMVTHNMRQALQHGNRLLIMAQGEIVDDVAESAKRALDEPGLIDRFRTAVAGSLTDRLIAG